jgi:hypothetical protein
VQKFKMEDSKAMTTPMSMTTALDADEEGCDALGFQSGLLTLMIRSTELTLVKRWST